MADNAPVADDLRTEDDLDYNPAVEPSKAKAWINLLEESEKAFENWNDHCDKIDKQFASLERLASMARDKEFQMFWANCETIKPAIYANKPEPVVVPKFKDRRPVYQAAAELAQRCATVAFDLTRINDIMLLIRDDVALRSRGVAWCRYESAQGKGYYAKERVCVDFKHRKDFLHSISRCWYEVGWVAAASYLTRGEARKRFYKHSGNAYQDAEYRVDRDSREVGGADNRERAKFWEIWHKGERRVVWVAKGVELVLDEDDPHLELEGFFPCPQPAYATVQPGSLVPVPEVLQYKDQLDEINLLTGRIHALSDALEAKGFYPAGGAELGDAVQQAVKMHSPGRILVPINNWAAFGGTKDIIVWLPIDMIAQTVTALVSLRKEIIQDIYQIIGLSDIMRGSTDPQETLGAQQLKSNYGSTRIRDKQGELVRLARDLVQITIEIISQKFDDVTIIEMSQTQLPTNAMVQAKIAQLQGQMQGQQRQVQQLTQQPQIAQMAQQNPQAAQQAMAQFSQLQQGVQQQIQKLQQQPTIDQVLYFLKDTRATSFVLDIETDSTIQADEAQEKQRRGEFIGMLAQLLPQLANMIAAQPQTAAFCGELLKFSVAPFRAGRSLDGAIDELVAQMQQKAGEPRPDDPTTANAKTALQIEQMKDQRQRAKDQQDAQLQQAKLAQDDKHKQMELANQQRIEQMKLGAQQGDAQSKMQVQNEKLIENREAHQAQMLQKQQDMALAAQKAQLAAQQHGMKQQDMAARQGERQAAQQFKMTQAQQRPPGV